MEAWIALPPDSRVEFREDWYNRVMSKTKKPMRNEGNRGGIVPMK